MALLRQQVNKLANALGIPIIDIKADAIARGQGGEQHGVDRFIILRVGLAPF